MSRSSTDTSDHEERRETLPIELVDIIIENLCQGNNYMTDLRSCSLVSISWVPLCRPRLFKVVELGLCWSSPVLKRSQLVSIIKDHPEIAHFIRQVNYTRSTRSPIRNEDSKDADHELSILFQLPNIRALEIEAPIAYEYLPYKSGTEYFGCSSLLQNYLSNQQLTSLSISDVSNVPLLDILSAPQMTTLTLIHCDLEDIEDSLPTTLFAKPMIPCKLKNLTLYYVHNLWFPLTGLCSQLESMTFEDTDLKYIPHHSNIPRTLSLPSLTSLRMGGIHRWANLLRTFENIFPVVTSLNIQYPTGATPKFHVLESISMNFRDMDGYFNRSDLRQLVDNSLPRLAHIHIAIRLDFCSKLVFEGIQEMISAAKGRNYIQSFTLKIWQNWAGLGLEEWWEGPDHDVWKNLSDTLSIQEDFPHLKEASFFLDINAEDGITEKASAFLEEQGYLDLNNILSRPLEHLIARSDLIVNYKVDIM